MVCLFLRHRIKYLILVKRDHISELPTLYVEFAPHRCTVSRENLKWKTTLSGLTNDRNNIEECGKWRKRGAVLSVSAVVRWYNIQGFACFLFIIIIIIIENPSICNSASFAAAAAQRIAVFIQRCRKYLPRLIAAGTELVTLGSIHFKRTVGIKLLVEWKFTLVAMVYVNYDYRNLKKKIPKKNINPSARPVWECSRWKIILLMRANWKRSTNICIGTELVEIWLKDNWSGKFRERLLLKRSEECVR